MKPGGDNCHYLILHSAYANLGHRDVKCSPKLQNCFFMLLQTFSTRVGSLEHQWCCINKLKKKLIKNRLVQVFSATSMIVCSDKSISVTHVQKNKIMVIFFRKKEGHKLVHTTYFIIVQPHMLLLGSCFI